MIDAKKIKRLALPNLPYLFLWWFFAKVGEAYRLSPGRDTLQKLIGTVSALNAAFANPLPTLNPFDMTVGLVGAAAIFCAVLYKKHNSKKWRKDREYGSARWGNRKDIEPFVDPVPDKNVILTATESLMLNGRPSNPKYARNKNVLVIGGSGSGKTRFFVKPNIMQLHSSYCVTDPKGQILVECGKLLKNNKYEIKVLNTIDFKKSLHYNPFPLLYKGGKRNTPENTGSSGICGTSERTPYQGKGQKHGINLRMGGRLSPAMSPAVRPAGRAAAGQIRHDAQNIPAGRKTRAVRLSVAL